ncbi:MAG: GGDEF domain-containing protein [Selenomonas sp.]|jgi:diguanylate cyclase (GGDEF)-like protein|nr:GGDEF domain-containing protein [Selenomonas sp.]
MTSPCLSFLVLPLIGGIVSSINNDIPAIWPSCVLSLLIVYMSSLGHRISTDSLTGLNNRFRLDSYLSNLAAPGTSTDNIYLFICDLDNFKQINDTYGHYEGDQALREASDLLKRTTSRDDFLARYGGDEFVLISTCETYTAALDLRQKIQQAFQTHNIEANHSYQISLSIGLSSCASDIATVFQQADEFLYAEKHRKKSPLLS